MYLVKNNETLINIKIPLRSPKYRVLAHRDYVLVSKHFDFFPKVFSIRLDSNECIFFEFEESKNLCQFTIQL